MEDNIERHLLRSLDQRGVGYDLALVMVETPGLPLSFEVSVPYHETFVTGSLTEAVEEYNKWEKKSKVGVVKTSLRP